MSGQMACRLEKERYQGWDALRMSNGLLTLHVVPSIGGRVIQLELGSHAYFSIHPQLAGKVVPPKESAFGATWKNYGGDKIWPAPQGWQNDHQWPGPPDPILDAGPYTAQRVPGAPGEISLQLTSEPDTNSGLQIGRTIRIEKDTSRVQLDLFMRNVSQRTVRWSIWEITQHDATDEHHPREFARDFWAYCPIHPCSIFPSGFNYMFGLVNHPAFTVDRKRGLLRVHYRYLVGKVGLDSPAGWLAVINRANRHAFFETFDYVPGVPYADNASVEFWLQGPGDFINNQEIISMPADPEMTPYLMESEVVSPLTTLKPGEEYHFHLCWFVGRTSGPITNVVPGVGAVHEPLSVTGGKMRRFSGKYAVFFKGTVAANFISAAGARLSSIRLGKVTPLNEFVLQRKLAVPQAAYRVSLVGLDEKGRNLGTLDHALLVE